VRESKVVLKQLQLDWSAFSAGCDCERGGAVESGGGAGLQHGLFIPQAPARRNAFDAGAVDGLLGRTMLGRLNCWTRIGGCFRDAGFRQDYGETAAGERAGGAAICVSVYRLLWRRRCGESEAPVAVNASEC